jgi:hypothetical protein
MSGRAWDCEGRKQTAGMKDDDAYMGGTFWLVNSLSFSDGVIGI